jgi:hypothetical protein
MGYDDPLSQDMPCRVQDGCVAARTLTGGVRMLDTPSYAVAIVVGRDAGAYLATLAARLHVWVCGTEANRRVAQARFASRPGSSLESGMTTFLVGDTDSAEEMVLGILYMVDLHHGEYSHNPPWDTVEVYGAPATPAVRAAFAEYDVMEFATAANGFVCRRPPARAAPTAVETSPADRALSVERRLVAEVPIDWGEDDIRWLVIEHAPETGGWFLFLHESLEVPCKFDSWYETKEGCMREAEGWGVRSADWREEP